MKLKATLLAAFIILSIFLMGCDSGPGEYDALAQCLTENGAVMYGTEWCSHCKSQKKLFGKSFEYVNYVDCDKNREACSMAGIQGFPTWVISGENYPGLQALDKLGSLAGCELAE